MYTIDKTELKYIGMASLFGFLYFIILLPLLLRNNIESQSPFLLFILFSTGLYFLYFFMFKSWSLGTKQSFQASVIGLLPFLIFDVLNPEYHVNLITGALDKGATLGVASMDYILGYSYTNIFGNIGWFMVPLVYCATIFIGLVLIAILRKNFVRTI